MSFSAIIDISALLLRKIRECLQHEFCPCRKKILQALHSGCFFKDVEVLDTRMASKEAERVSLNTSGSSTIRVAGDIQTRARNTFHRALKIVILSCCEAEISSVSAFKENVLQFSCDLAWSPSRQWSKILKVQQRWWRRYIWSPQKRGELVVLAKKKLSNFRNQWDHCSRSRFRQLLLRIFWTSFWMHFRLHAGASQDFQARPMAWERPEDWKPVLGQTSLFEASFTSLFNEGARAGHPRLFLYLCLCLRAAKSQQDCSYVITVVL